MPRRAALEPKRTTKSHSPWVVNLPAALSSSGRRERRYFSQKKVADQFCRQQKIRLENYGTSSTYLPAGKVEEAQAAFDKLEGTGISLTQAVDQVIKWKKARESTVTFKTMFERFIEAKSARSEKYRADLRCTLPRFGALHDQLACEVSASEIEEQLQGMSASVRNAFLRYLKAVFNFGIRRGWCNDNPIKRIDMQRVRMRRQILSNSQVRGLLHTVCKDDLELLTYHLLCIFSGIRPEEVCRLNWTNINMAEHFVEVPDESAKTEIRRIVEMEPLLIEWLNYFVSRGGNTIGAVTPKRNLRKRLRALRKTAKVDPWPQDAPRRTFASNWLAVNHDVNRLNNLMGHTSPAMLWRHYHRAVTQQNATEFWKIEPPKIDGKTIRFVAG
jgi:integrase/recombinase XerD